MEKKTVSIEFCSMWGYFPKAVSLTDELYNNFKGSVSDFKLIPSGGGVFEVAVDGQLIFSKKELKRFPDDQEISQLIDDKALLARTPE